MSQPAISFVERRQHPRIDLYAQVHVKRGSVDLLVELRNLSVCGALLDLGTLRPPGWIKDSRVIQLGIVHPVDLDSVVVEAKIMRTVRNGRTTMIGVEFIGVEPHTHAGLQRLLEAAPPRED